MSLENYIPDVAYNGVNTAKDITASGTNTFSGTTKATGAVRLGTTALNTPIYGTTSTVIDAQNGTPTIAQLLGGIIRHNSKTGAGTLTTPTGAELSAGIADVAVGYTFDCLYVNYGNQTVTITPGASGVTVTGTAAITTGKNALMRFVNTAANTWIVYPVFG